jgi:2,5-diamino-6-(ribosylamino)-4(3H)-pyrimidinone 5'-phosphate reductase
MDLPELIVHNTISLNGGLEGFEVDLDLHYRIAGTFNADAYMVGSQTILEADTNIPQERKEDRTPRIIDPNDHRPFWIVVDSRGRLEAHLHFYRNMPFIKEIIVLVSMNTPKGYIDYLTDRHIPYLVQGSDRVDYSAALNALKKQFSILRILVDTGETLSNILIQAGLVHRISLVVAPEISPQSSHTIFRNIRLAAPVRLQVAELNKEKNNYLHLVYTVLHEPNEN